MQVKNVLLTGAGGKIGRAVLPELSKAGYHVRALEYTDGLKVERLDNVEVVSGDLRDPSLARRLIEGMDVVIHLANVKENKELFLDANIKGTFICSTPARKPGTSSSTSRRPDARGGVSTTIPQPIPIDENHRHWGIRATHPLSKVLEEVMRAVSDHVRNADHDPAVLLGT